MEFHEGVTRIDADAAMNRQFASGGVLELGASADTQKAFYLVKTCTVTSWRLHLVDDCIGDINLESLQTHDAFLQTVPHEQAVNMHSPLLPQAVSPVHGLPTTR